ncbi:MAG: Na+/H+ antiporter NhaC [Prolixibacteraceae bacterium]|nr:Na+/H+ antiporter NhaC [Prolixibacteraceae bacterium]MBN2650037.1 Na+/H+ antiporter NhaC [Prolixibacteraceae bacterium]
MTRKPTLFVALLPILFLIITLTSNVFLFDDVLDGPNQIALLLAASVGIVIAWRLGFKWENINSRIVKTIGSAMPSMLILLLIGSLAGTWLISGTIPVMVFYGLDLIHPKVFLVTAVIVSSVVSVVTGSSWSTVATIGVALLGIGKTMGFDPAIVGGAIISGAYFGDKISPLSDTTNLAPAMAGTDLFTHIRYMTQTTIPSMLITLVIFLFIGFFYDYQAKAVDVSTVQQAIESTFNTTPWLLLVPIILFAVIVMKVPPLPSLMIGTLLGGLFAVVFQPDTIEYLVPGENYFKASYMAVMQAMFGDVSLSTDVMAVNELLSTSGMRGMLNTVWLILTAMIFGGVMEAGGLLERITRPIVERAKSTGSLVASTVVTCLFFNTTASDQYISIVVPGRMFKDSYAKKGLKPEVLSRTLEDSGTMTSALIPWNTCGATQAKVLGVETFAYAPYAFFNIISPLMTIAFAYLNIKIRRYKTPNGTPIN